MHSYFAWNLSRKYLFVFLTFFTGARGVFVLRTFVSKTDLIRLPPRYAKFLGIIMGSHQSSLPESILFLNASHHSK